MRTGKYNQSKTVKFSLVAPDGVDLIINATFAAGDIKISKDEGAEVNTTNLPTDEGSGYSLVLTATEMSAARISLYITDQTATKIWLDIPIEIETYGNASAEHAFDLDLAEQTVDVVKVSGGSSAADNLELQYDTTGLSGDTFPATQSQVSSIVNTGSAINVLPIDAPNGFTLTTGSEIGDEDRTHALDGTRHELSDAAGTLDVIYKFDIGGDAAPVGITFTGSFNSANDSWAISANIGTDATPIWQQIGTLDGSGGASNTVHPFDMFTNQIVTDLAGIVQIRVNGTGLTSSSFDTDQVFVSKSDTSRSVGYANGRIWINEVIGNASTVPFFDGFAERPVTLAAAKTLSASIPLGDFQVINGSEITLAENTDNESYFGDNWALALGGQSVAGAYFQGAKVSGIGVSSDEVHFEGCDVATMSTQKGHFDFCSFDGTVTHTLAGDYNYHNCYSKVAGVGSPTFAKTAGQTITAQWRNWAGSITVSGVESGDVMTISGTELGAIVLNGADGTVKILGEYESLTDNRTGSPTLVLGAFNGSDIADTLAFAGAIGVELSANAVDDIWDEVISKSAHNVGQSAGKILRQSGELIQIDGAVSDASPTTTDFDTNLTQADTYFSDAVMIFVNGAANAGIGKPISTYVNASGHVTFTADLAWPVTPVNGDDFVIVAVHEHPIAEIQEGLATEAKQDAQDAIITEDRLAELDAANLPADIADIPTAAEFEARTPTAAQLAYIVSNSADGKPVTFTGGTTTTAILGNVDGVAASSTDDAYNGRILIFNAGTLDEQATDITDYDGATKTATITAVTTAVTSGHTANLK